MLARLVILLAVAINIGTEARADWAANRPQAVSLCRSSCQQHQSGVTPTMCANYCDCTTSGMETIFTPEALNSPGRTLTADEQRRLSAMAADCSRRFLGRQCTLANFM